MRVITTVCRTRTTQIIHMQSMHIRMIRQAQSFWQLEAR